MMQGQIKTLSLATCCLVLGLALLPSNARANEKDWAFVQSIGGMKLGKPEQKDGNWTMSVTINVSGTETITVKPTEPQPHLICEGIGAEPHDHDIYLALFTGYPWLSQKDAHCPDIVLGHLDPGTYQLYYKGLNEEPVKLNAITLTP